MDQQGERLWGDLILTQPVSFYLLTGLIASATCAAVLFLCFNDYQRKQAVSGFLVPQKGVVAVYPVQPGLLVDMWIEEGGFVEAGEDLARLQVDRRVLPGASMSERILQELHAQQQSLRERVALEQQILQSSLRRQDQKIARLVSEVHQLEQLADTQQQLASLEKQSYDRHRQLFSSGNISRSDADTRMASYLERRQNLQNVQLNLSNRRHELEELRLERQSLAFDAKRNIADLENNLAEIAKQHARTTADYFNIIKAPVSGQVSAVLPAPGQRIGLERPLFSIIPEDAQLEAQLYVPTNAIGFLQAGQVVNMRYEAFPYQRFGLHGGRISQIARTVLTPDELPPAMPLNEPAYKVTVQLDRQYVQAYGHAVQLKPGMVLSADVVLDNRSLFEWLFEPLFSLKGRF